MTLRRFVSVSCATLGIWFAMSAAWIPVKAEVAQVLLHRAWGQAQRGNATPKPWPWADTWPVGRLRAPRYGVDEIVLAGASGSSLAFAPGHVDGTALPGHCGNCVIGGHRDTQILHRNDTFVLIEGEPQLTLITCYPFDAVVPGGPLRFVVWAELEEG